MKPTLLKSLLQLVYSTIEDLNQALSRNMDAVSNDASMYYMMTPVYSNQPTGKGYRRQKKRL